MNIYQIEEVALAVVQQQSDSVATVVLRTIKQFVITKSLKWMTIYKTLTSLACNTQMPKVAVDVKHQMSTHKHKVNRFSLLN